MERTRCYLSVFKKDTIFLDLLSVHEDIDNVILEKSLINFSNYVRRRTTTRVAIHLHSVQSDERWSMVVDAIVNAGQIDTIVLNPPRKKKLPRPTEASAEPLFLELFNRQITLRILHLREMPLWVDQGDSRLVDYVTSPLAQGLFFDQCHFTADMNLSKFFADMRGKKWFYMSKCSITEPTSVVLDNFLINNRETLIAINSFSTGTLQTVADASIVFDLPCIKYYALGNALPAFEVTTPMLCANLTSLVLDAFNIKETLKVCVDLFESRRLDTVQSFGLTFANTFSEKIFYLDPFMNMLARNTTLIKVMIAGCPIVKRWSTFINAFKQNETLEHFRVDSSVHTHKLMPSQVSSNLLIKSIALNKSLIRFRLPVVIRVISKKTRLAIIENTSLEEMQVTFERHPKYYDALFEFITHRNAMLRPTLRERLLQWTDVNVKRIRELVEEEEEPASVRQRLF